MDIWQPCKDQLVQCVLSGELLRIVESQEQVATNALVDTLHEQEILEHLIEQTKPKQPDVAQSLHYLLSTPFRYPPLPYGSRFGSRLEPGLLYGSLSISTLLYEAAYYRFVFWYGMSIAPPSGKLLTQHLIFTARYHSTHGVALQQPPCNQFTRQLTDPANYATTQLFGNALRQNGIEIFEYISARDPARGINVGLFSSHALADNQPTEKRACLCETRENGVSFYGNEPLFYQQFPLSHFQINGKLPQPAL